MLDKLKKISGSWYFLGGIILIYILFFFLNKEIFSVSISFFEITFIKIIPIFFFIFILMSLSSYYLKPKFILKHLGKRGLKKWLLVIIGGFLSSGPIYLWYPLLADLRKKGLSDGLIACFLYNRAIKVPLIPLAIAYFSWQYIFILVFVMAFFSVIQGLLVNKLIKI